MNHQHGLPTCQRAYAKITLTCLILAVTRTGFGQEKEATTQKEDDLAIVTPFVSATTFMLAKVDIDRVQLPDFDKALSKNPQLKPVLTQVTKTLQQGLQQMQILLGQQPVYATAGIPISKTRVPIYLIQKKTSAADAEQLSKFAEQSLPFEAATVGDHIVATIKGTAGAPEKPSAAALAAFRPAVEQAAKFPMYIVLVPPKHVWQTLGELTPTLPRQLGGGPSHVLTDGVEWVAIGVDPQELRVDVTIQSTSEDAANALAAHLPVMLGAMCDSAQPIQQQLPIDLARQIVRWLDPKVEGTRIRMQIDGIEKLSASIRLLAGVSGDLQESARRNSTQNKFRQILLGMHNYHDTYRSFPPSDKQRDKQGTPRLSWRVHILPFVEQTELYNQFRLDESWDSPHNRALIASMPPIFASDSATQAKLKPGYTTFLAPSGKQTIFGGKKAKSLHQIKDGTSNTIALVEVVPEKAIPWTAPLDYQFEDADPLAGVRSDSRGQWISAFADGSVHHMSKELPVETARYLFQIDDGNYIDLNQ